MNIFSNIGITELIFILLLALLVVGPERLPEVGQKLGKTLRDVRKAYENLTKDLGPELASLQETTKELRDSVDSVRAIPKDIVKTVVKASDLEDTVKDFKGVTDSVSQMGEGLTAAKKTLKDPMSAALGAARDALDPTKSKAPEQQASETGTDTSKIDAMQGQTQDMQTPGDDPINVGNEANLDLKAATEDDQVAKLPMEEPAHE